MPITHLISISLNDCTYVLYCDTCAGAAHLIANNLLIGIIIVLVVLPVILFNWSELLWYLIYETIQISKQSRQNKVNEMKIFNTIHDGNVNWLELEKGSIRIPYTDYEVSRNKNNVTLRNEGSMVCSLWNEQAREFLALTKARGE